MSPWHTVAVLLAGDESAAPSSHGTCLVLSLSQQLVGLTNVPSVLVYTSGVLAFAGANEAHGGAWGFARVL